VPLDNWPGIAGIWAFFGFNWHKGNYNTIYLLTFFLDKKSKQKSQVKTIPSRSFDS
jgi:hypothetical protein